MRVESPYCPGDQGYILFDLNPGGGAESSRRNSGHRSVWEEVEGGRKYAN
jgi:hypothetical protein